MSVIQKRIKVFREIVSAVCGHPAICEWLVLDRAMEWVRPELHVVDLVLKSFLAEIREKDEEANIALGVGWSELLEPQICLTLGRQVDGIHISGLENRPQGLSQPSDPAGELLMAAYMGTLAKWLFNRSTEIEVGWGFSGKSDDLEVVIEAGKCLAFQGLKGIRWLTLVDPEPTIYLEPPWALRSELKQMGLMDHLLEPKSWVEALIGEVKSCEPQDGATEFIDLGAEDYLADPHVHFPRLWEHFLEANQ